MLAASSKAEYMNTMNHSFYWITKKHIPMDTKRHIQKSWYKHSVVYANTEINPNIY